MLKHILQGIHHPFRGILLTKRSEPNQVADEDGDVVIALRTGIGSRFDFSDGPFGKNRVEQVIGFFLFFFNPAEVTGFQVTHAFLIQTGGNPCVEQGGIDRFGDVVIGTGLNAFRSTFHIITGGDHDHRDMPKIRVGLDLLQDFQPTDIGHHQIQ